MDMKKTRKTIGILVVIVAVILIVWVSSGNRDQPAPAETETAAPTGDSLAVRPVGAETAPRVTPDEAGSPDTAAGAGPDACLPVE